ncbi:hypothetical protein ACEQPO_01720 [Bacillus sp. SL00103]
MIGYDNQDICEVTAQRLPQLTSRSWKQPSFCAASRQSSCEDENHCIEHIQRLPTRLVTREST